MAKVGAVWSLTSWLWSLFHKQQWAQRVGIVSFCHRRKHKHKKTQNKKLKHQQFHHQLSPRKNSAGSSTSGQCCCSRLGRKQVSLRWVSLSHTGSLYCHYIVNILSIYYQNIDNIVNILSIYWRGNVNILSYCLFPQNYVSSLPPDTFVFFSKMLKGLKIKP